MHMLIYIPSLYMHHFLCKTTFFFSPESTEFRRGNTCCRFFEPQVSPRDTTCRTSVCNQSGMKQLSSRTGRETRRDAYIIRIFVCFSFLEKTLTIGLILFSRARHRA